MTGRVLHAVVPEGIDDPDRPSGGNLYDRRLFDGLRSRGWDVVEHQTLASLPVDSLVLVDGLVVDEDPAGVLAAASRARLVVLLHMAPSDRVREVLAAAAAVVTTSRATRRLLDDHRWVEVAEPGVDPAPPAPGTPWGGELLCVASVIPGKGHDVLLDALAGVRDLDWRCACVGSLDRDLAWAGRTLRQAQDLGLDDRVAFPGVRGGSALAASYDAADALVLATRAEGFGMVAVEALARGIPVIASAVGGLPEVVGHAPDGTRPGLLVPPDDAPALTDALRRWLEDASLRDDLRAAARRRRGSLPGWRHTVDRVEAALSRVREEVTA